jgi:hypothetical protein
MHLPSALTVCAAQGRVAFGTNLLEWFADEDQNKLRPEEGWPVLIYASRPELGDLRVTELGDTQVNKGLFLPARVSFAAIYATWTQANDQGKHPNPQIRPTSTETDTEFYGYWEVTNLHRLGQSVRLADLRIGKNRPAANFVPRRAYVVQGDGF